MLFSHIMLNAQRAVRRLGAAVVAARRTLLTDTVTNLTATQQEVR